MDNASQKPHHQMLVDVTGSHRFLFFTSTQARRTKKGRQVLNRRTMTTGAASRAGRHHPSSSGTSSAANDHHQARAGAALATQHSSTQTDMRDSEMQTDPWWWYRSEGLPLLCCRGTHRKLERAQWLNRSRMEADAAAQQEDQLLMTGGDGDRDAGSESPGSSSNSEATNGHHQKTVACGPSYGAGRAYLPDPLDLWVSTYTKLRLEDNEQQIKVASKRRRLLERHQRHPGRHHHVHVQLPKRTSTTTSSASSSSYYTADERSSIGRASTLLFDDVKRVVVVPNNPSKRMASRRVSAALRRIDASILDRALDQLCHNLQSSRL